MGGRRGGTRAREENAGTNTIKAEETGDALDGQLVMAMAAPPW